MSKGFIEHKFYLYRIEIGQSKFEHETSHFRAYHLHINIFYFLFFCRNHINILHLY